MYGGWQPQFGLGDDVSEVSVNPCAGGDAACQATYDTEAAALASGQALIASGASYGPAAPNAASAAAGGISTWLNQNAMTVAIGCSMFVGLLVIGAGKRR
jgi:hypothetical protein